MKIHDNFPLHAESLPGGAIKCDDSLCSAPLICPIKLTSLESLNSQKQRTNLTVKVRVKSKSELKRGIHRGNQPWAMFFMHVTDCANDQVDVYVKVSHSAQQHFDFIEVGKAYYFSCVELMNNPKGYSKIEGDFGITFLTTTIVLPVYEKMSTLQDLCLRTTAAHLSRNPKKESMVPILSKVPLHILELLFRSRYLTFEAICELYYTEEYHNIITSYTMAGYILTRETSTIHAIIEHKFCGKYQNLHCVYDDLSPFRFTARDEYEQNFTTVLPSELSEPSGSNFPIVPTLKEFKKRFSLFSHNCLEGINWDNLFCAGGSVLAALQPLPPSVTQNCKTSHDVDAAALQYYQNRELCPYGTSDVDIFLWGLHTDYEVDKKLAEVIPVIVENVKRESGLDDVVIVRTLYTVSIVSQFPYRIIQLVLFPYTSPAHVLVRFDLDSVCVGFDGSKVWASHRGIRSITKGYNLIDIDRIHLAYAHRLYKYSTRGFSVVMPNTDQYVDAEEKQIRCSYQSFRNLRLANLLKKLQEKLEKTKKFTGPPEYSANIPWQPDLTPANVYEFLKENNVRVAMTFEELSASRCTEMDDIYKYWVQPENAPSALLNWRIPKKTIFAECWYMRPQAWTPNEGTYEESLYYTRISGPLASLLPQEERGDESERERKRGRMK